jgi:hypothetical protein
LAPASALACSCANTSADVLFQRADAVFAGKVVAVEGRHITFEVEKSWKYVRTKRVTVYVEEDDSCFFGFVEGARLIVHARLKDGSLVTHRCMGVESTDDPVPRFASLQSRPSLPLSEGDSRGIIILIAAAALLLGVTAFLALKRKWRRAA